MADRTYRDFLDYVDKTHEFGCWIWQGRKDHRGYGCWGRGLAHRYAWTLVNGAIPPGRYVLHICDQKACVNPRHLYVGTIRQNAIDAATRGQVPRVNAVKTHCPAGHPYAGENLYVIKDGGGRQRRWCKECNRVRSRERQRVQRRARGLKVKLLSDEEKQRIRDLRQAGWTLRAVATETGRSLMAVRRALGIS